MTSAFAFSLSYLILFNYNSGRCPGAFLERASEGITVGKPKIPLSMRQIIEEVSNILSSVSIVEYAFLVSPISVECTLKHFSAVVVCEGASDNPALSECSVEGSSARESDETVPMFHAILPPSLIVCFISLLVRDLVSSKAVRSLIPEKIVKTTAVSV